MHAPMLANIIFPAPSTAYVSSLLLPLAGMIALASECAIYARFSARPLRPVLIATIAANVFSWLVGLQLSRLLPSGLVPRLVEPGLTYLDRGPDWFRYAWLSYPAACVMSFALEFAALYPVRKRLRIRRLASAAALANAASYAILGLLVLVFQD